MKVCVFVFFSFISTFALADIANFKGHIYSKDSLDTCLKDLAEITKNVESVKDFLILDGGCLAYTKDTFRIEFNYSHPLAQGIEDQSIRFSTPEECLAVQSNTMSEVNSSLNQFVFSYCGGRELHTHYINTTHSVFRTLDKLGKFDSLNECRNFLESLKAKSNEFKITSVMSFCSENQKAFIPVFNYLAFVQLEMNVINGNLTNSCLSNLSHIEEKFSANEIKVVFAYCPKEISSGNENQETVIYMKPKGSNRYIHEFEGIYTESKAACEPQLEKAVKGLELSGVEILYSFCKKIESKIFRPSVTYIKIID